MQVELCRRTPPFVAVSAMVGALTCTDVGHKAFQFNEVGAPTGHLDTALVPASSNFLDTAVVVT